MIDDSQLARTLVDQGAVAKQTVEQALTVDPDQSLYHTLIDRDLVDETTVVQAAAALLNVEHVDLEQAEPGADVLALVPESIARRNVALPLRIETADGDRQLVLAMADPIDVLAMDEVASHTGVDIRPVLAGPRAIARAIERAYGARDTDDAFSIFEEFEEVPELPADGSAATGGNDSWAAFFEDAGQKEDEVKAPSVEDSAMISREMQDRATSNVLDAVDGIEDDESEDALLSLDEPLSESQLTGGIEADLGDWELDEAIDGSSKSDYRAIGSFYVNKPGAEDDAPDADAADDDGDSQPVLLDDVVEPADAPEAGPDDDDAPEASAAEDETYTRRQPFFGPSDEAEAPPADDLDDDDESSHTQFGVGPLGGASESADPSNPPPEAPEAVEPEPPAEPAGADASIDRSRAPDAPAAETTRAPKNRRDSTELARIDLKKVVVTPDGRRVPVEELKDTATQEIDLGATASEGPELSDAAQAIANEASDGEIDAYDTGPHTAIGGLTRATEAESEEGQKQRLGRLAGLLKSIKSDPSDDATPADAAIRETRQNPAVTSLKAQASRDPAQLAAGFVDTLARHAELDETDRQTLGEASPRQLVQALIVALVQADLVDLGTILAALRVEEDPADT